MAVSVDGELADFVDAAELATDAYAHPVADRLHNTGVRHLVLRLQHGLYCGEGDSQGRQLGIGNFDPDFFILQAQQLHLAHVIDPL